MTHSEIVQRGKLMLVVCLAALVGAMALSDWQWSLMLDHTRTFLRYGLTIGLGIAALNGSTGAKHALAGLIGLGVLYAIYTLAQLGFVLPKLSVWMSAHALLNAIIACILLLSPSISRYQSSRNELVMP